MTEQITISLDAMGGDNAPEMVIEGARLAQERCPGVHFLLYGDEHRIRPHLGPDTAGSWDIRHTDKVVSADAKPSQALRKGSKTSMRLAIDAVRDGLASGVVSAGNTGALMAMSKFSLRTLPGIYRPAIASKIPTMRGEMVMLDLGANIQCDADTLVQFAIMGADYAHYFLGLQRPTVGLLNVGEEELKGNDTVRAAHDMLRGLDVSGFEYFGFVEGNDITKGTVDVVVTDGFTGNIALKSMEGTARLMESTLRTAYQSGWRSKLGYLFSQSALKALRKKMDPNNYNGAIFLGLNGIAVKSHGGTDARGFANAIGIAFNMVNDGMIDQIRADFEDVVQRSAVASREAAAGGGV